MRVTNTVLSVASTSSSSPIDIPTTILPTTTVALDESDFTSEYIDTSSKVAVQSAWELLNDRPRHRMNWTGSVDSCIAGTTDRLFQEDILYRVQWFRAMAGVSPRVTLNQESSRLAQEAALVMAAAGDLSHEPDSDWPCYTQDAHEGASQSNLYLGEFGVPTIDGYIEDSGEDNYAVGHRRWILDPTLLSLGTGDTRNSNALFLTGSDRQESTQVREDDGYVMWPPRGHVPRDTIFPRWSVSHRQADFSEAEVKIEHEGRVKVINNPHSDSDGYGGFNSLVFNWIRPAKGTGAATITVSGIELDGTMRTMEYEVSPFG
jgi:hypothetical protein